MKRLKMLLSYLTATTWISLGLMLLTEAFRQENETVASICLLGIFFLTNGIISLVDLIILRTSNQERESFV